MDHSPLILGIDTATLGGSICLTRRTTLLAARVGDPAVSHSNSLLKDINASLAEAQVSLNDIDLLAVAAGPGSFTGLRIGLATVKGLAATLRIPCVGIPTLYAVAHSAGPSTATIALLPAGRGEVFAQMMSVTADGNVNPLDEPAHLSPHNLVEKYSALKALKLAGPGAHVYRDLLESYAREKGIDVNDKGPPESQLSGGWTFVAGPQILSQHVAVLALQKYESNELDDPLSLSAIYVRPSDAELKCP